MVRKRECRSQVKQQSLFMRSMVVAQQQSRPISKHAARRRRRKAVATTLTADASPEASPEPTPPVLCRLHVRSVMDSHAPRGEVVKSCKIK